MAKIIFKVVIWILKVFAVLAAICSLYTVGAVTWTGVKEAWKEYASDMNDLAYKFY